MENPEIYTITIVRNIGIPISFTVKRWKVLAYFTFFILLLAILLYCSFYFIFLLTKTNHLEQRLDASQKKVELLNYQIEQRDRENYNKKQRVAGDESLPVKNTLLDQGEFSTEEILATNKNSLSLEELQGVVAVDIDSFDIKLQKDDIVISVALKNSSQPKKAVGGYLCITLVNRDKTPAVFKSLSGPLGENGFPSSYKQGRQYFLRDNNKPRTVKQRVSLSEENEYYTRALIFIYSYKGSLLNRRSIEIKKEIFLE